MNKNKIKKCNYFLLYCFCLLVPLSSAGQQTPEQIMDKFFADFEKAGIKTALERWFKNDAEGKNAIINQFNLLEGNKDKIGEYCGHELIDKKAIPSFSVYSFMLKYVRQPFRITILFYKPKDDWIVFSFKIDDKLDEDLENAIKLK